MTGTQRTDETEPQRTLEEQRAIEYLERLVGRKLTDQEIKPALEQLLALGEKLKPLIKTVAREADSIQQRLAPARRERS
jgi:hypothetical protein